MRNTQKAITIHRIKRKHGCDGKDCKNDAIYNIKTNEHNKFACEDCYNKLCAASPLLKALKGKF